MLSMAPVKVHSKERWKAYLIKVLMDSLMGAMTVHLINSMLVDSMDKMMEFLMVESRDVMMVHLKAY